MRQLVTSIVGVISLAGAFAASPFEPLFPPSAGQSAGKPGAVGACSLLPKAEVKKIAAADDQFFDMVTPREESLGGRGSACSYSGIHIQVDPFPPSRLEELRKEKGKQWTVVPDVGDAAYLHHNAASSSSGYAELYVRVGPRVVTVQKSVRAGTSVDTVRPAVIALAKALVAKLQ